MKRDRIVGDGAQNAPIYLQLIQALKERIQSGAYGKTGKLESENELCALFDCSRPTVRKALSILIAEGLIRKYPKKGYFLNKTLAPGRTRAKGIAVIANLENDVTNFQSYPLLVQLNNLADIYGFQLQFHYFNQARDIIDFLAKPPEGLSAALIFRPPQSWLDSLIKKSDFLRKKGLPSLSSIEIWERPSCIIALRISRNRSETV
jgi:DNA-binding transcriptional regulator YhcF (GntR family)